MQNRRQWLGGACFVMALSFMLLGASAWLPGLYVAYTMLKAVGGPFLAASEQVLNQKSLDIRGTLSDRIFAREFVLWALRMLSLFGFWSLATLLTPTQVLAIGSLLLALATMMEYLIGQAWMGNETAAA